MKDFGFVSFSHLHDDFHWARKRVMKILNQVRTSIVNVVFHFLTSLIFQNLLDETVVDPVYETLKVAAETRKLAVANYLQQRQQTLNKQTSLNSQGSSEPDTQSSPRNSRHASRTETEIASSLRATPPVTPRQRTPPTGNIF